MTRRRLGKRAAVVLAAVVVASGSAAAAVSVTESSAPLSGSVPPQSVASLGFSHYQFEVFPEIEGGQAGWCVWVYNVPAGQSEGGMGGCGAGAIGATISAALATGSPATGSAARGFAWLMVPAQVVAVRLRDGRTIRTVADRRLPNGFRGVVFFAHSDGDPLAGVTPLEPTGRPLQVPGLNATPGASVELTTYWTRHQPPARGRCSIAAARLRGLRPQWGRIVNHLRPAPGATAGTFLACASTSFQLRGHHFYTAVLTDAVHPGAPTGSLPGLARVAGHRDVYHRELPPRFIAVNSIQPMVARRTSRGWLVVESTAPLSQRLEVLVSLSSS